MITTKELIQFVKEDLKETKKVCKDVCVMDLGDNLKLLIDRLETYEYLIFKAMGKKEEEDEDE